MTFQRHTCNDDAYKTVPKPKTFLSERANYVVSVALTKGQFREEYDDYSLSSTRLITGEVTFGLVARKNYKSDYIIFENLNIGDLILLNHAYIIVFIKEMYFLNCVVYMPNTKGIPPDHFINCIGACNE